MGPVTTTISLEGKTAIVTGGARGLGLAIAEQLACAGARVALVDMAAGQVHEAAGGLQAKGLPAMAVVADVSDGQSVKATVDAVLAAWGRVDILVNNAGLCPLTPPEEITEAEWDRVLSVNLKGTFLFAQAVMPVMRRQHSGKIINMTSSAAQTGGLIAGLHYSASKGGIISLTRSLARLLAPEIQVNAVAPGMIDTPMTNGWSDAVKDNALRQMPLHRMGQPADVAWAVLYLASDASDFIVGHTLAVSGGLYMG